MTAAEIHDITKNIKDVSDKITGYSERAQLDLFLNCYDNTTDFLHISSDGKLRNYEEFKKTCAEYYDSLKEQKVMTLQEKIHVIDTTLVILGWTGNIIAQFKNGDIMKMNNYAITSVFKKMDTRWKVIHSHESSLPPEIIKK